MVENTRAHSGYNVLRYHYVRKIPVHAEVTMFKDIIMLGNTRALSGYNVLRYHCGRKYPYTLRLQCFKVSLW